MSMIGQMASHYKILDKIGEGGMGVVYRALDTKLDRTVALKVVPAHALSDPRANARLIQEAKASASLNHPNICTIYEFDETDDGQTFIAMEFVHGKTLKELIVSETLDPSSVADYALQLAKGLQEAHEHGIVHRDIKSANIMITDKGLAKIMDFGLAKLAGRVQITKTGSTVGTAAYMSPEQARGEEVGAQSDLFSLGVVIYEMLSGCLPFKGDYEAAVAYSVLNSDPAPIASHNSDAAEWQPFFDRALDKDLSRRYQTDGEFATDITAIQEKRPIQGRRVPISGKRNRILAIGAVAAIAILIIGYAVFGGLGIFPATEIEDPLLIPRESQPFSLVLAPFWGPTDEALDEGRVMHALVERAVRDELGDEEDVTIFSEDITELPRSHDDAEALAERLGATMVIWGEVLTLLGEVEIQPYLTVSKSFGRRDDLASAALVASVEQPDQISLRKSTADDVKDMALMSAARYYMTKEPEKALSILDKITEKTAPNLRLRAGILDGILNRLDEAERIYEEIVEIDSDNMTSYLQLGGFYARRRQLDLAETEYEKARKIDPCNHRVLSAMSSSYANRGESERAVAFLKDAITSCPGDFAPHSILGWTYSMLRRWDEAIEENSKAVELEPTSGDAHYTLGWAYEFSDSLQQAAHHYSEAIRLKKKYWATFAPHVTIGRVFTKLDRYDDAIAEFRTTIEISSSYAGGYSLLHIAYTETGEFEKAQQVSEMALAQNPNNFRFHYQMGISFARQQNMDMAMAFYGNALRIDSMDSNIYYRVGLLFSGTDEHEEAIQNYERSLVLDSAQSFVHSGIGYSLRQLNRHEEAIPHYETAISLNSRNVSAYVGLVSAFDRLRHYDDARATIERYQMALPDNWGALQTLGLFQYRRGEYGEATKTFKTLIDQERRDLWTNYQHAWYYLSLHRTGDLEAANTYLATVVESLGGDPWTASIVRYYAGEISEFALLEAAENDDPTLTNENLCEAYYYIGVAYLLGLDVSETAESDTVKASEFFEKSISTDLSTFIEYQFSEAELQRLDGQ